MNRLITALLCSLLLLAAGCASFERTSGKALASSALTVDAAMKAWAQYVVLQHPPADQEAKVRAAYEQYQRSMRLAQDAWLAAVNSGDKTWWESAFLSLTQNEATLLALIREFRR